jgi:centrosomal protein CEP135
MASKSSSRRLQVLRKKLGAMNYHQLLTAESVELVEKLFSDLIVTTSSYSDVQKKFDPLQSALGRAETALEPLRQENARVVRENNELHADLIRQTEDLHSREREWSTSCKSLQRELSELKFMNEQQQERIRSDEQQAQVLQRALEKYVGNDTEAVAAAQDKQKLAITKVVPASTKVLIYAAGARADALIAPQSASEASTAAALGQRLQTASQEIEGLQSENSDLSAQVELRNHEILRLGQALVSSGKKAAPGSAAVSESSAGKMGQLTQRIEFLEEELAGKDNSLRALSVDLQQSRGSSTSQASGEQAAAVEQQRRQLDATENLLAIKTADVARLSREQAQRHAEIQFSQAEVVKFREICSSLQAENDGNGATLKQAKQLCIDFQTEKADLQQQISALSAQLVQPDPELDAELSRAQVHIVELQGQAATLHDELTASRQGGQHLQMRVNQLGSLKSTPQQLSLVQDQLAQSAQVILQEQRKAVKSSQALAQFQMHSRELELSRAEITSALEDARQENTQLLHRIQRLIADKDEFSAKSDANTGELQQARTLHRQHQLDAGARLEFEAGRDRQAQGLIVQLQKNAAEVKGAEERQKLAEEDFLASKRQLEYQQSEISALQSEIVELQKAAAEAKGAEARHKMAEAEMAAAKRQMQYQQSELAKSTTTISALQNQNAELQSQAKHLQSLFAQVDIRRQETEHQLSRCDEIMRRQDAQQVESRSSLAKSNTTLEDAVAEANSLRNMVAELDDCRDTLQHQLDEQAEELVASRRTQKKARQDALEAVKQVDRLVQQINVQQKALGGNENEISSVRSQMHEHEREVSMLRQVCELRTQEVAASAEDLAAMTRENQVVASQLHTATTEQRQLRQHVLICQQRANQAEQESRALALEKEDLLCTYRSLCDERSRLISTIEELQSSQGMQQEKLQDELGEAARMRTVLSESEEKMQTQHAELLAYERQVVTPCCCVVNTSHSHSLPPLFTGPVVAAVTEHA